MGPIGVFDSGVGGLSVWRRIVEILPNESTIFYADNANCPYGSKSKEEIISYSEAITRFLLSKGCKAIVVACNTATGAAIDYLRKNFDVPFIGIEPATKPASLNSKTHVIGVLATKSTLESESFNRIRQKYEYSTKIIPVAGIGLMELVEQGKQGTKESLDLLRKYIDPLISANTDKIVLGCTHYPFLINDIKKIIGTREIEMIDPAGSVAGHLKMILEEKNILAEKKNTENVFYHSGNGTVFERMLKEDLGIENPSIIGV